MTPDASQPPLTKRFSRKISPTAWTWVVVLASISITALTVWFSTRQDQITNQVHLELGLMGQSRLDLMKGYLHLILAGSSASPFDRQQGLVLLDQAQASLEEALQVRQAINRAQGGQAEDTLQTVLADFVQDMGAFRVLLARWQGAPGADPALETEMRITFSALEQQAGQVDLLIQQDLAAMTLRYRSAYTRFLMGASLALGVICAAVYVSGRAQQRAEAALKVALTKYKTLFDSFPLGITVSDQAGVIVETNSIAQKLLGISAEQHVQRKIDGPEWQIVRPDGTPMPAAEFASVRALQAKRLVAGVELGIIIPGMPITWLNVTAAPLPLEGHGVVITYGDITRRKQAEDALRGSREYLQAVLDSLNEAVIVIDADGGQIVDVNQGMCNLYGYTQDEAKRLPLGGLCPGLPPFSQAEASDWLYKARRLGPQSFEWLAKHHDGRAFWVEVNAQFAVIAGQDRFVLIVREITARKAAEAALRSSLHKLEEAERISHLGHYEIDISTGRAIWSQEVFRIFDVDPADGEPTVEGYAQFIHAEDRAAVYKMYQSSISQGEPFDLVYRILRRDGHIRYVHSQAEVEKDDQGQAVRLFGTFADITASKLAEEKIHQLNSELEQRVEERTRQLHAAQEKLVQQEKLAVLGQLAGGVGHELRNPLGVINNAIYLLNLVLRDENEKVKEYLEIIRQETQTADQIINDLLEFSRTKSVNQTPLSVPDLARQVLARYTLDPAINVDFAIPADLPLVYADSRQIRQVLANLVVNACQAMPEGGKLILGAAMISGEVAITIQDTGSGIAPEHMPRLFEPLFTTKPKGIGLGLAVSKKLVEANGGRIQAQSQPGMGSTFTIFLPLWDKSDE